jgi:ligand-binding sensor domain-containing protein/signal transduction histidine kinase
MRRWLSIFALTLGLMAEAHAVVPSQVPEGYSGRLYGVASGLPEETVQAFAQTPDHYLWIGTTGGLARFDGTHFTVFDRENTPAFRENSIFCLLSAKDGSLWIGTEGSGLVHYKNGAFRAYGRSDGLTDFFVRALAQDAAGAIWIGTNNGLFRIAAQNTGGAAGHEKEIERVDANGAIPSMAVNAICVDTHGRLWLGGSRLAALDNGVLTQYQLPGDAVRNRVKAIAETSVGTMWVGTVAGLYRMLPGQRRFEAVPGIHGTTRGLRGTSDGHFWMSVLGQGTVAYRIDGRGQLSAPTSLGSDTVLTVFEDMEQNIWLGTETGMLRLSRTPLTILSLPHAGESDFGTVYQDREGQLWTASTQLFRLDRGVAIPYAPPQLAGVKVREVFQGRDLSMWFGTDGSGVFHISGDTVRHYTASDGLVNNFVRAILQARDGTLWIGTDEGVSHFDGQHFSNYRMKDGLAYQSVRSMLEDRDGDIWIGTELGLSHLHNGTFVSDAAVQALRQEKVWALHQDASGSMWIGTRNNGLFRLHDGALVHFRVADGLTSPSILDIEEDRAGHFWISGPIGISLLDRHELDRFAEQSGGHLSLTFYSTSNDAETVQVFGGMQTAGALTPDGDVWFPSNRGLIHIAQQQVSPQPQAPLVIKSVLADGRELQAGKQVELSPGNTRLEIDFASLMMRSQEALRFRYKLDPLDKDWNDAGTRHVADYTNVPPGRYVFRVAAYDLSRPNAVSEASLIVLKDPHIYSTWWFLVLCVVALAALALMLHRIRVAQVRRRFQAVIDERNRLAREVHDTILQGCTSVSAVLEAVSTLQTDEGTLERSLLDSARAQIRTTINEAREAVWALRHDRAVLEDLTALMETMRSQLSREFGVAIECDVEGQPFAVNRPVAHELMMIAREAVHNAASHAAPTIVRLHLDFRRGTLGIGVTDDGCGFEPELASSDSLHFGLTGMRERAAKLGGTFHLSSTRSTGTCITVNVPCDSPLRERDPSEG